MNSCQRLAKKMNYTRQIQSLSKPDQGLMCLVARAVNSQNGLVSSPLKYLEFYGGSTTPKTRTCKFELADVGVLQSQKTVKCGVA